MKTMWNVALALGLLPCIAVGIIHAQDKTKQQEQQFKKQEQERQQYDVDTFLKRFDRNKDNAIQKDELPKRLRDGFAQLDKNNNDKLDREELRQHAFRMNAACDQCQTAYLFVYRAARDPLTLEDLQDSYSMLRMIDKDNNGNITKQEIQDAQQQVRKRQAQSIVSEWDTNKDGKLSRDEASRYIGDRWDQIDRNNDDFITLQELEMALQPQRVSTKNEKNTKR